MKPETLMIDETKYIRADAAQVELPTGDFAPWEIGESYFIRTVTQYLLGRLVSVGDQELVLSEASWVADTGRYNQFVAGASPSENEPIPGLVIVSRGSVVDAVKREVFIEVR